MASMRLIVPLADPGAAQIMHPGGQSGHPREPSSRDLYRPFTEGAYVPLYFDDPDVLANATQTTVLEPTE
jgi:acyl-homoserine lactone acylase PvdQ